MSSDVLLVETPCNFMARYDAPRVFFPLGSLYLSRSLKRRGFTAVIYDPKLSLRVRPIDEKISCLGDDYNEIEDRIRREQPGIVAVSNLLSKDMNHVFEIARRAKRVSRDILTVVGGNHATVAPQDFIADRDIDAAVAGEGEETICDLVRYRRGEIALEEIQGIAYLGRNGEIVLSDPRPAVDDLDELGFPDYGDIDYRRYAAAFAKGMGSRPLNYGRRPASVISSRGCPYQCFFCGSHRVMGRRFRAHSAGALITHLSGLVDSLGIDFINFEDDNLTFDRDRFERIVDGLAAIKGLQWATPNGIRADSILDAHLLREMKRSGCRYLTIGVESGDQEFLASIVRKSLRLETVRRFAGLCREAGLPLYAFFIIGFPGETRENLVRTLAFARLLYRESDVYPFINYAIPVPGTRLHTECVRQDALVRPVTYRSLVETTSSRGSGLIRTDEFSPHSLRRRMKRMKRRFLIDSLLKFLTRPGLLARYAVDIARNLKSFLRQLP